ncbi:MAG: HlyD family type I secretion periplasmic adaptor subunit [Tistlia sp.]|uniref:HlyD family type I secretion periplasmic adaptor subunit n=1 Tax=Tistlia sp. TaxID=3057121 RepID=UPI0034A56B61
MSLTTLVPTPPGTPQGLESHPVAWGGSTRLGLLVLLVAFGGFLAWSLSAHLASAVIASASVVIETDRKAVQHLEGGIVREVLVGEGDLVAQGQPLVRLDPLQDQAESQALSLRIAAARAQIARTTAEQEGLSSVAFPSDLQADAERDPAVAGVLRSEQKHFQARRAKLVGERDILANRRAHAEERLAAMADELASTNRQIELVTEELAGATTLHKKGYAPKTRLLALERERERLRGIGSGTRAQMAQQQQQVTESELEVLQLETSMAEEASKQFRAAQSELGDLTGRATTAGDRLDRLALRAPAAGYVVKMMGHGPGSVVRPGETLMEIVPRDEALVIEAMVAPADVDNVAVGRRSEIRFSGLTDRNQAPVFGSVAVVSADRLLDEATNTAYYSVRVAVDESELGKLPTGAFRPGAPAEVLILGSDRTLLDYLTDPLFSSLRLAFREE